MRIALILLAGLVALPAGAATTRRDFTFRAGDFDIGELGGRALVTGRGMDVTDEPGKPQLPVRPVALELAGNCAVRAVRVTASGWTGFGTDAEPFPSQPQVVLSRTELTDGFTGPDPAVYGSDEAWPAEAGRWSGTGRRAGNTVVDLLLYPVRRAEGRLERCGSIRVEVEYDLLPPGPALDPGAFEYVIITSTAYDSIFQRLADWKTRKGVPAVIRHIDWVYANYTGRDNAERLRNYTRTLPDSGVEYVLLGGDVSVVPFRKAFAMVSEGNIHNREDSLPCDLYFADSDGDWDSDGDNCFGEVEDSVDLYPDLYVGRAPVDSRADAQAFVNKVLEYERSPAMPRQRNALFFAEVMWTNPYTDGGVHKDRLEARSFTGHDVTKKYERMGNESRASVMAAIRDGQNCLNHDGHGWIDVMSCGGYPDYLRTRDGDTITNAYKGIMFSIGCWTTAFDEVSIGEAFVTNPNGGAAAFVGNSSYGWGSPGNPGFGYSDKFDDKFWAMIHNEGEARVGAALAESKAYFAPFSRGRNVYRWHQYQLNLMGCPEMPAWTAVPESLRVSAPAEVPPGAGRVLVTVLDEIGEPVEGALACLMKGDESYSRAVTGADGAAWLDVSPTTPGSFDLTVTARDRLPWQGTIPVGSGAWVNFAGWTIDDAAGNGDGIANPGEAIVLPVLVHNAGDAMSGPKEIALRSIDPCVVITDSLGSVCELAPGESLAVSDAFAVSVLLCPEDGHGLRFDLVVRDPEYGEEQVFYPVILVGRPRLSFERYWLLEPPLLPAESGDLRVCVANAGHGWGHDTRATLQSLDPHVTVLAPESVAVGEVAPRDRRAPADSFRVSVGAGCPPSYLARMELVTRTGDIVFRDTFDLLVGNFGFADDIESGDDKWTHGGSVDRWHISTHRANSGTHSWYCGDSVSRRYSANTNCWLETDEFMVAENCSLKFWRWFSVPNYGVDGIYVIARRGAVSETLDFIGTGGALEDRGRGGEPGTARTPETRNPGILEPLPFGIESDWFQEKFDLSHIPAGETISIRIGFKSDGEDNDEGFYIDDFEVTGNVPPLLGVTREGARSRLPAGLSLAPNPLAGGFATLRYSLPQAGPARVTVFDVSGRQALDRRLAAGRSGAVSLDLRSLSAGIYLVRLETDGFSGTAKLVVQK